MKLGKHFVIFALLFITLLGCDQNQEKDPSIYAYLPQDTLLVYKIIPEDSTSQILQSIANILNNNTLLSETKSGLLKASITTNPVLTQVEILSETLLAFSKSDSTTSEYTFVTKQPKHPILLDSIKDKKVETLQFKKKGVTKVTANEQETFYTTIDSTLVISSSLNPIKKFISKTFFKDRTFQKLVGMPSKNGITILKNNKEKNSWSSLHLNADETTVQATGILIERDSLHQQLSYFKDQVPQAFTIPSILPDDIKKAIAFTYSDAELLVENLQKLNIDTATLISIDIAASFNEMAQVEWKGNSFIIGKSIDAEIAFETLETNISEVKNFRNTPIYTFNSPDYFNGLFGKIGVSSQVGFMFESHGYFIFCPSKISAESLSAAIMSDALLSKSTAFKDLKQRLTRSITYAEIARGEEVPALLNAYIGETQKSIKFKKNNRYDLAITQFTFDHNFAHVNFVTGETLNKTTIALRVSGPATFTIKEAILSTPVFFVSRNNRNKSVAFQDVRNTLRGYSNDGKLTWSKKLNSPILGDIQDVDIKRNGKKQLAFVTKNNFYIVDENGKDVAPFPLKFRDNITQPLAIFDYDNTRKYRFIITQGKEVVMLDSKGKIVKGFTFKKGSSTLVATPQHIRLGNKDYLLFQEQNGKLNILSRTGKQRINVGQTFKFNGSNVQQNSNSFVLITAENEQKTISKSGKVTTKKLNIETDYSFVIDKKTTVSLNDNLLRINGKLIELPFGIYTKPSLFQSNKTTYITVTETQEKNVYLYKTNGAIVNGFPVYGTATAIITKNSRSNSLQLLVAGDQNELLLYTIK